MRVLFFVLLLLAPCGAQAQTPGRFTVRVEGQAALPVRGLADRFGAHATGALGVGRWQPGGALAEVRAAVYRFRPGSVRLLPDTTGLPAIDADSIGGSLDLTGASLRYVRPFGAGRVQPYLGVGVGLYYWVARRAAYPSAGLPDATRRAQWSAAAEASVGAWIALTPRLRADAGLDATIVPGELWAAERIRLGNVRTFSFLTPHLGLLFSF